MVAGKYSRVVDDEERLEMQQQIAAEPNLWTMTAKAYPPKVIIENEIFPHEHEIYNCTTCTNADPEHPIWKLKDPENYHVKCRGWNGQMNTGPRWNDIGCPKWDRKIPIPNLDLR